MTILVTGAFGFIGGHVVDAISARGLATRLAVRNAGPSNASIAMVGDIGPATDWSEALEGIDAVIHLAARVHVVRDTAIAPLEAFRAVNVEGTRSLAIQAARAGVRRFVFASSVKVNGEATQGRAFTERDPPRPEDPYGVSKREAEDVLCEIAERSGLEVAILRVPLVYGSGVKANFLRMMHWIDRRIPLPLANVENRRSLVYLGNLVDAIVQCVRHPAAGGATFLVDDGEPVSTPQLLREIGVALDRPARLFPVPVAALRAMAVLVGRGEDASRLLGDLVVDSSLIRRTLDWKPPFTRQQGLAATAAWFRAGPR
ncbi:MAG: SDR family oxidoreductase [Betaproteobacteria bacterium]